MKTVYDEEGNSFTVDPVDAREYIATGRFFTERPVVKATQEATPIPETRPEAKKEAKKPIKKTPSKQVKYGEADTDSPGSKVF